MSNVIPGVPHSPAGWPTIEEGFDEDTMSRGFDMTPKGFKSREGPSSRMTKWNAKVESLKSFPDLVDKFPISLAMGSLTDKVHEFMTFLCKDFCLREALRNHFSGCSPALVSSRFISFLARVRLTAKAL